MLRLKSMDLPWCLFVWFCAFSLAGANTQVEQGSRVVCRTDLR